MPPSRPRERSKATTVRIYRVAQLSAAFYREQGRSFPWRGEKNLFRLAIAEVLLQKTRAQTVVPVYEVLCYRYPRARDLARASNVTIQGLLLPLGLHAKRAEQLRAMAAIIEQRGVDILEDWKETLKSVPGLGSYGARAVSCFGRRIAVGIVDANVARIERRVFGLLERDSRAAVFQEYADRIAEAADAPDYTNYGLLDIGASVCLSVPRCGLCPLKHVCLMGKRLKT